jgi:hypothetical protein
MQCDWLYHELSGLVDDYSTRQLMEPEEETAARRVLLDLETGISLAQTRTSLHLQRLRAITQPQP